MFYVKDLDDILQNKISFDNHSSDTPFCQSNQPLPIVTPGSTILLETNGTFHDYSLSWYEAASRNRNSTINEVIYADDVHCKSKQQGDNINLTTEGLATSQVGSASIIGAFKIPRYLRRSSVYMIYGLTNVEPEEQFWVCLAKESVQ